MTTASDRPILSEQTYPAFSLDVYNLVVGALSAALHEFTRAAGVIPYLVNQRALGWPEDDMEDVVREIVTTNGNPVLGENEDAYAAVRTTRRLVDALAALQVLPARTKTTWRIPAADCNCGEEDGCPCLAAEESPCDDCLTVYNADNADPLTTGRAWPLVDLDYLH